MLLRSGEGATDAQIVAAVGSGIATVERIRKRFVEEGLEEALSEKPRPPMPPKQSGKSEVLLLASACSDVPEGRAKWSMQRSADKLAKLGAVDTISDETARRSFKKARRSHGSASSGTAEFVCCMEDVLDFHAEASDPDRPRVCFDEMPLQFVSEVGAPLPARPGKIERFDLGVTQLPQA